MSSLNYPRTSLISLSKLLSPANSLAEIERIWDHYFGRDSRKGLGSMKSKATCLASEANCSSFIMSILRESLLQMIRVSSYTDQKLLSQEPMPFQVGDKG